MGSLHAARPRVREGAVPRAHERRVVRVLEHGHRENASTSNLTLPIDENTRFAGAAARRSHELEQRRDVVAFLVRRVPRETQHEGLGRVVEDHVDLPHAARAACGASPIWPRAMGAYSSRNTSATLPPSDRAAWTRAAAGADRASSSKATSSRKSALRWPHFLQACWWMWPRVRRARAAPRHLFAVAQDRDDFPQHLGHVEVRAGRQLAPDALAGLVVAPLGQRRTQTVDRRVDARVRALGARAERVAEVPQRVRLARGSSAPSPSSRRKVGDWESTAMIASSEQFDRRSTSTGPSGTTKSESDRARGRLAVALPRRRVLDGGRGPERVRRRRRRARRGPSRGGRRHPRRLGRRRRGQAGGRAPGQRRRRPRGRRRDRRDRRRRRRRRLGAPRRQLLGAAARSLRRRRRRGRRRGCGRRRRVLLDPRLRRGVLLLFRM